MAWAVDVMAALRKAIVNDDKMPQAPSKGDNPESSGSSSPDGSI